MNIQITKNAWKKISEIIHKTNNQYGMIYSASSGGCNGFNFELELLTNGLHQKIKQNKFLSILSVVGFFIFPNFIQVWDVKEDIKVTKSSLLFIVLSYVN